MTKREELAGWARGLKNAPNWSARVWHLYRMLEILFAPKIVEEEAGQATVAVAFVLFIGLAIAAGGTYLVVNNRRHAEANHGDSALAARTAMLINIQDNEPGIDFYYRPVRGTVLGIARLGEGKCAGAVWRVTEDNGQRWLGDECYECTTFTSTCSYWNGVVKRDGYLPLASFPDIQNTFIDWLRVVTLPQ